MDSIRVTNWYCISSRDEELPYQRGLYPRGKDVPDDDGEEVEDGLEQLEKEIGKRESSVK